MTSRPLISVVIPSYNCARYVTQAVESALAQTYTPVEVIVVDDGSTDGTAALLAPYRDRVRYVYQTNQGLSAARNRGIREARGELIAFLDADDQWLPEKLVKQHACLAANPAAGLVHTDLYRLYESTGEAVRVYTGRDKFVGRCYPRFFWGHVVTPSTVMVTRHCLDRVGTFDEAIPRPSVQDQDLWMRIAREVDLSYVDEPLVLYRHHAANNSHNTRMMVEDELYVLTKALKADPALWAQLGRAAARRRLGGLAFGAGYLNMEAGELRRARQYFAGAVRYTPLNLAPWAYWLSTLLPRSLFRLLRRLKQQFTTRVDGLSTTRGAMRAG